MERTNLISALQKFHFGSKIFCLDGEGGVLTHVGFEYGSYQMGLIGVRLGRLFGRTVYLPFVKVVKASGEGVTLSMTYAELAAAKSVEPDGIVFDQRSSVQCVDRSAAGALALVAVEPDGGELRYIVVHNLRAGRATLLRQEYVKELRPGLIIVDIADTELQMLAPYRSDEELQHEVEDILFDLTPLHIDFRGMNVRVLDSVLYLDGNISSSLRADMVQDQAQGVQGLLEIENRLVGDDVLAGNLALTLARDPRTHGLPIGVYPRLGVVRLSGAVRHEEQKAAAGEIASSFPGVRSVINDLVVNPEATMLYVMSAAEGGDAEDIVPGKYVRHTN